jgi:hypothetical protein
MITQEGNRLATYRCLNCETERPYGYGGEEGQVWLKCTTCIGPERHVFVEMNNYTTTADADASGKIVAIKFERTGRA